MAAVDSVQPDALDLLSPLVTVTATMFSSKDCSGIPVRVEHDTIKLGVCKYFVDEKVPMTIKVSVISSHSLICLCLNFIYDSDVLVPFLYLILGDSLFSS